MASRVFAVDLGAYSVKIAVATPGMRGSTLTQVVERLVPAAEAGSVEPAEVRSRAVLAQLVDELKLRGELGYIGVYGDTVFTQVIEFGFKSLRRSELDKAVGGELEGVVPVDLEDMVYTFEQLPPLPAAASGPEATGTTRGRLAPPLEGMRVLTYAMHRERAEALIKLGIDTGYEPRGVLACAGAAIRLVERTPSVMAARTEGAVAVVDIGHERTDIVVVCAGKAVFSRSIARAGKQVTEAIARHWHLPWGDAERAKHTDGFIASQAEPATSDAWSRIHQVTIAELQPFARDLRQTLAACRAKTGFTAGAVLLVGGGARLRGLGSFLTEQVGIPSWRLTPDDVTALAGPRLAATATMLPIDSSALTIGMVMDAASGRPLFDLRSGALAVRMDLSFLRAKAVPLGAAVLAIAAFAAGSAFADLYRLRKAEKILSARLATESAEQYGGKPRRAEDILAVASGTGAGLSASPVPKVTAYDTLLDLSAKVPTKDKITLDLDKIEIEPGKVELGGITKTPNEVDALGADLKKVVCVKEVVRGADTSEDAGQHFQFTLTLECP